MIKSMKVKMKVTLDRHQANDLLRLLGYEYGEGVKRDVKIVGSQAAGW